MLAAAPAWADQCAGALPVGTATGCGALITVFAVGESGNATAFTVTTLGNGNPYDGTEDSLIGVQNSSGAALNSIHLSASDTTFGGIFNFDFDGPCAFNEADCHGTTGYEGPDNTFAIDPGTPCGAESTCRTSGTVNFTTPIPNLGSTWFALEGGPLSFATISQTQTLHPGQTAVYPAGNDNSKWTPSNNQGGELLTVTAVPIPRSVFDANPPTSFPGESCVPYADFSAANGGQDTCVEFQAVCAQGTASSNDCETFLYQVTMNYDLPPDQSAIGGPDFLVLHGATCPQTSLLNQSIFLEYGVSRTDPHTTAGGGGISCFVATFRPGAPLITGTGTTVSRSQFVGWESPVVDNKLNMVKAGSTRPLKFQWFDPPGNPDPNLTWCANTTGTGCTAPWVNLQYFFVLCPAQSGTVVNTTTDISSPGNSGFQNLGGGNYQMNWQTQKSWKGSCANVEATFSNGLVVVPATPGFQFN
jgi:hypothetical protein